jgi:Protein of unknown function (DUF2752)
MCAIRTADLFMIDRAYSAVAGHRHSIGVIGLATAALAYLAVVDPHRPQALLPPCPTKLLTGLDCPACGGLRLVHDLLHADLSAAVHDNPFLLFSSPILAFLILRNWQNHEQVPVPEIPVRVAVGLAATAMAWMVLRNLPGWRLKPTVRPR